MYNVIITQNKKETFNDGKTFTHDQSVEFKFDNWEKASYFMNTCFKTSVIDDFKVEITKYEEPVFEASTSYEEVLE